MPVRVRKCSTVETESGCIYWPVKNEGQDIAFAMDFETPIGGTSCGRCGRGITASLEVAVAIGNPVLIEIGALLVLVDFRIWVFRVDDCSGCWGFITEQWDFFWQDLNTQSATRTRMRRPCKPAF